MKQFLLILILFNFLVSCQSAKDALTLKKKNNADEFLVEKKNPLVEPPEFGQLPVPGEKPNLNESSNDNIKNILSKGNNEVSQNEASTKKIEENILDKIKNR
mgnify:CR=1 FL=1